MFHRASRVICFKNGIVSVLCLKALDCIKKKIHTSCYVFKDFTKSVSWDFRPFLCDSWDLSLIGLLSVLQVFDLRFVMYDFLCLERSFSTPSSSSHCQYFYYPLFLSLNITSREWSEQHSSSRSSPICHNSAPYLFSWYLAQCVIFLNWFSDLYITYLLDCVVDESRDHRWFVPRIHIDWNPILHSCPRLLCFVPADLTWLLITPSYTLTRVSVWLIYYMPAHQVY